MVRSRYSVLDRLQVVSMWNCRQKFGRDGIFDILWKDTQPCASNLDKVRLRPPYMTNLEESEIGVLESETQISPISSTVR
jgi:hypothetical protein